jgi:hypothetical protein
MSSTSYRLGSAKLSFLTTIESAGDWEIIQERTTTRKAVTAGLSLRVQQ